MLRAKLSVVGGDIGVNQVTLDLPAILGRGTETSLPLGNTLVSRRHCELFERDGVLWVRDLGSLNGTFVGSQRIEEQVLASGDLLTVGTITFRSLEENQDSDGSSAGGLSTATQSNSEGDTALCDASAQNVGSEEDVLVFDEKQNEPHEKTTLGLS